MNKAIKTLIVGVDFSMPSKQAVEQARVLAKAWNARIVFVHVFTDPFVSEVKFADIIKSLKKFHHKRVEKFYGVTSKESVQVEVGSTTTHLIKVAKKFSSPMIVVGFRGHNNAVVEYLMGSTSERLLLNSPYPVWVQRDGTFKVPQKILIPTDLKDRATQTYRAVQKMKFKKVKMELFHVVTAPAPFFDYEGWKALKLDVEKANSQLVARFKKKNPQLPLIEENGFVVEEVVALAKKYDVLAISPKKSKGFFRGFGSVNSKILRQSPVSVLVIP